MAHFREALELEPFQLKFLHLRHPSHALPWLRALCKRVAYYSIGDIRYSARTGRGKGEQLRGLRGAHRRTHIHLINKSAPVATPRELIERRRSLHHRARIRLLSRLLLRTRRVRISTASRRLRALPLITQSRLSRHFWLRILREQRALDLRRTARRIVPQTRPSRACVITPPPTSIAIQFRLLFLHARSWPRACPRPSSLQRALRRPVLQAHCMLVIHLVQHCIGFHILRSTAIARGWLARPVGGCPTHVLTIPGF